MTIKYEGWGGIRQSETDKIRQEMNMAIITLTQMMMSLQQPPAEDGGEVEMPPMPPMP